MSRCYGCCQDNCASQKNCDCSCHDVADQGTLRKAAVTVDRATDKYQGTGIMVIRLREFRPGERVTTTKEVSKGWLVDFDEEGKPIQIEVMSPKKHFPKAILNILSSEFESTPEETLIVPDDKNMKPL